MDIKIYCPKCHCGMYEQHTYKGRCPVCGADMPKQNMSFIRPFSAMHAHEIWEKAVEERLDAMFPTN